MTMNQEPITDAQYLDRLKAANLLRAQGFYPEAETMLRSLFRERPEESSLFHSFGQFSTMIGRFEEAEWAHKYALDLLKAHGTKETHLQYFQPMALGLAQARMRLGKFDDYTWSLWEAGRLEVCWSPWPGSVYFDGSGTIPESLLIQTEGGYGDLFMFMRWIPWLKSKLGIKKIGLMAWASLYDFCDWKALGVDEVYRIDRDSAPFTWQASCSIMTLPAIFKVSKWEDIPSPFEPLGSSPYWDFKSSPGPSNPRFRIGFCWRSEENSSPIKTKSLPRKVATEVNRLIHTQFEYENDIFTLSPEMSDLYGPGKLKHPDFMLVENRMRTWRETAEYICSMDLILTVDTAVAHLAGLLGVPALVLCPASSCWRWGMPGDPCHWYGPALTLYRQKVPLVWEPEEIFQAFKEKHAHRRKAIAV